MMPDMLLPANTFACAVRVCVCVCVRVCVRASMRPCVCACTCVRVFVFAFNFAWPDLDSVPKNNYTIVDRTDVGP